VSNGAKPGENVLMKFELSDEYKSMLKYSTWLGFNPIKPRYFAVMTGWGATGEWDFKEEQK